MKKEFFIAGVQFRPKEDIAKAVKEMKVGDQLILDPEPTNRFDPNAVKILSGGGFLGYVPKKYSSKISALISIELPIICTVEEVNPLAKTYEMIKVAVSIPIDEDEEDEEIENEKGK